MYESWTVGEGNGGTPATSATPYSPFQYTSASPEANQYILFVHGWNLQPYEKDAFASTAYKRLYWQGYKGRFPPLLPRGRLKNGPFDTMEAFLASFEKCSVEVAMFSDSVVDALAGNRPGPLSDKALSRWFRLPDKKFRLG